VRVKVEGQLVRTGVFENQTFAGSPRFTFNANGRNEEIRAWVEEHPEIKTKIEERIRNVPPPTASARSSTRRGRRP
jgi:hypothetical protein